MKKGFTLVELMLVMGIMAVLFGIATMGYFGTQGKALLVQGLDILAADLRSQQTKAMTGTTAGGTTQAGFGIHFDASSYTLFAGDSYVPGAVTNSVVPLPGDVTATTNFPGGNVVFLRASGEVKDYAAGQDYVDLTNGSSNKTQRMSVNRLGVIREGI